jgi:hypothetical protein
VGHGDPVIKRGWARIQLTGLICHTFVPFPSQDLGFDKCFKLVKVLKNNLAKNDIFVISGYGPFIFIRPSKYGLIMAYRCSSVRPRDNVCINLNTLEEFIYFRGRGVIII